MQSEIFVSEEAETDLKNILFGLIHWTKGGLEENHAHLYVEDIVSEFQKISSVKHHFPAVYTYHKLFGKYIHRYRRNNKTMWYIVYDLIEHNIYINKVISNHLTFSKKD